MIKQCFAFLLLSAFILMVPLAAYADVLVEPNNDFYSRHRDECTPLNRSFYANGEGGSVSLKKQPGSKAEVAAVENGEVLYIMFMYNHKGELWGVAELYAQDKPTNPWHAGWIPMNQLLLVYDYISFAEEHQADFYPYTGSYDALKTAKKIVLWPWPGSGKTQGSLEAIEDENFQVSHAYTDEQGREWGFVGYWYGRRNAWVCLNDPANSDIPAFNPAPQPDIWQPGAADAPKGGLSVPIFIVILVAALVVGTAVLIRVLWKPKGNS